jgi:hypothetical protein
MSSGDGSGHILLMDFDKEYNETTLGVAMKGPQTKSISGKTKVSPWNNYVWYCMIVKLTG